MSVLPLKLNINPMLGSLTSVKKIELLGIGHQGESLEPATSIAAMKNYIKKHNNNSNNNNNGMHTAYPSLN